VGKGRRRELRRTCFLKHRDFCMNKWIENTTSSNTAVMPEHSFFQSLLSDLKKKNLGENPQTHIQQVKSKD